jgi:hypothetical protein
MISLIKNMDIFQYYHEIVPLKLFFGYITLSATDFCWLQFNVRKPILNQINSKENKSRSYAQI